ncbi:MAG: hypothetical protein KatS3mg087_1656 [Patescibacteria group bacterium]|nr:MAG: hypothetical protein KatS3mg087_1656 [Patescibacteria group bacterium]
MNITQAIVETIGRMARAFETYLKTREAAYRRSMDKRMRRAVDAAERYILRNRELHPDLQDKELLKWERIFWKYNG